MDSNKNYMFIFEVLFGILLVVCFCAVAFWNYERRSEVLGSKRDTLFACLDSDEIADRRVYLQEEDKYVPFLVIGKNAGGVLLMREYAVPTEMQYSIYSGYYDGCVVDTWLNTTYYDEFGSNEKFYMRDADIDVSSYHGIVAGDGSTELISRKIFVPSVAEYGFYGDTMPIEGDDIMFFKDNPDRLVARNEQGEAVAHWTRSGVKRREGKSHAMTELGVPGEVLTVHEMYVRPLICFAADTPVKPDNSIIKNKSVLILSRID